MTSLNIITIDLYRMTTWLLQDGLLLPDFFYNNIDAGADVHQQLFLDISGQEETMKTKMAVMGEGQTLEMEL